MFLKPFPLGRIGVVEAKRRATLELGYWQDKIEQLLELKVPVTRANLAALVSTQKQNVSYCWHVNH